LLGRLDGILLGLVLGTLDGLKLGVLDGESEKLVKIFVTTTSSLSHK